MAINFTNLNELKMYIQAQINSTLENEVVDEVTNKAIEEARKNVYGAYYYSQTYEPVIYDRRYEDGGLIDPENFKGSMPQPGVIEIRNITPPHPRYDLGNVFNLSELIEYGDGGPGGYYNFPKGEGTYGDFHPPRPFMNPTKEKLSKGDTLKNIIKEGLKRRGLTVK